MPIFAAGILEMTQCPCDHPNSKCNKQLLLLLAMLVCRHGYDCRAESAGPEPPNRFFPGHDQARWREAGDGNPGNERTPHLQSARAPPPSLHKEPCVVKHVHAHLQGVLGHAKFQACVWSCSGTSLSRSGCQHASFEKCSAMCPCCCPAPSKVAATLSIATATPQCPAPSNVAATPLIATATPQCLSTLDAVLCLPRALIHRCTYAPAAAWLH